MLEWGGNFRPILFYLNVLLIPPLRDLCNIVA